MVDLKLNKVPKLIHQLWIGDKPKPSKCLESIKDYNPDYEYMFWDEETLSSLSLPTRYRQKIDLMEELNGKCDMYRWIILEKFGGVFIDADIVAIEPLDDFLLNKSFFCWEQEQMRPNLCATTVMGFTPNHSIPQMAINWILQNRITSPAWVSVGPQLLSNIYHSLTDDIKKTISVFPSYYFLPDHLTGFKYKGHGKVYTTHLWGSTHRSYEGLNTQIPEHHMKPSTWIDLTIDDGTPQNKIKEIVNSVKHMPGHFGVNIKCNTDIRKYIKSTRFVNFFDLQLVLQDVEELPQVPLSQPLPQVPQVAQRMDLINENNHPVNLNMEYIEQQIVKHYIRPDDKVLELGARYGSVSITTNKILNDKTSHYVVEPDNKVWDCLERNMKTNNTEFNIIKGVIGKDKVQICGDGYATHTIAADDSEIECFPLPHVDFNVLIADCEGYLETFFDDNLELFNNLYMVIFETDRPEACDYDKIISELLKMGFTQKEKIPEPGMPGMYHYVFIKEDYISFDNRKEMIKHYADKIDKPKILELGVFKGEFLDYMVENIDYDTIGGVDLFYGNIGSGDQDGNNVEYVDLEIQFDLLNSKYQDNENVNIYKTFTDTHLKNQSDNFYDIIYIDADHSYPGAKRDILLAHEKVRDGGYIMGHDYEMNMDKAKTYFEFGVRQAVDEYCVEYNQKIIAKGMDGCVSFCIKVDK